MRTLIAFPCAGETLLGTLDDGPAETGVLIVSGGNEIRAGAHRGMAMLAQALAARGLPVFRFDRRGIGDSTGENGGWASSRPDIAAAVAAFRAARPGLRAMVAFGNCDAATALALFGPAAGIARLVLANPWLGDDDPLPPPAAIRALYAARLADPAAWQRLACGGIDWRKLGRGLRRASGSARELPLARRLADALADRDTTLVIATGDRTAQHFLAAWTASDFAAARTRARMVEIATASHSFVGHADAIEAAILSAVQGDGGRS